MLQVRLLEKVIEDHYLPGKRVDEALTLIGLSDQAQKTVSKLSPNTQRRLAFIRALMGNPLLVLLDQPTLRTDLDTQALFARLIKQAASEGATILATFSLQPAAMARPICVLLLRRLLQI